MEMHDNRLLPDLDAIQIQCGRESKKRRKINGNASRGLRWILPWIFYHKRNSSLKQVSTLNLSKNLYLAEKRYFIRQRTFSLIKWRVFIESRSRSAMILCHIKWRVFHK